MELKISLLIFTSIILVAALNDSDIIIMRTGHSEIERQIPETRERPQNIQPVRPQNIQSDVVFVRNDDTVRHEDNNERATEKKLERMDETEKSKDVIFLTGKNNDNVPEQNMSKTDRDVIHMSGKEKHNGVIKRRNMPLDCSNIICNNTLESLCGKRNEDGVTKYRLFRNDCYFKKVNCGFRDEWNRYSIVDLDKCAKIAAHIVVNTPDYNTPNVPIVKTDETYKQRMPKTSQRRNKKKKTRSISKVFRRSLSMDVDGKSCYHSCPTYCTDVHVPQCALSSSGQQKVFLNHCKLDYDSCLNNIVWYRRPLHECVGLRKTQVEQNRDFIGWMQRSGIIDKKGRLIKP